MTSATRQSFPLTNVVANPILIPLLKSWLDRPLGRRLAVVEYVGRRSGDRHQLVAQYVRNGREVVSRSEQRTTRRGGATS